MNQRPQIDDAIGRSAMTKAMWRILPLILLAYVVAYVDRVNVSFASLQMNDDLKFSATIYGLGGGLFFLGYALFEVPSSLMLARFRARQLVNATVRRTEVTSLMQLPRLMIVSIGASLMP